MPRFMLYLTIIVEIRVRCEAHGLAALTKLSKLICYLPIRSMSCPRYFVPSSSYCDYLIRDCLLYLFSSLVPLTNCSSYQNLHLLKSSSSLLLSSHQTMIDPVDALKKTKTLFPTMTPSVSPIVSRDHFVVKLPDRQFDRQHYSELQADLRFPANGCPKPSLL